MLCIQNLDEGDNSQAIQDEVKNYRILKLMTGWDQGKMYAIGRHLASHNMLLLEVRLPQVEFSGIFVRKLAKLAGLSYNDQFVGTVSNIQRGKYILVAALMSANQRAIYKVQID